MPTTYNTQYNTPRVQVQLPGRQNRLSDGTFRVTPSMTEPVRFFFGNQDGVPLNLLPFSIQFVVWLGTPVTSDVLSMGTSEVVLNKKIIVNDPHSGEVEMVLTEKDTLLIGNNAAGTRMFWSLFMVNEEGQVFPTQVSSSGSRYGTVHVDLASGMPIAELIRNPTA